MLANRLNFVKNFTTLISTAVFSFLIVSHANANSMEERVNALEQNVSVLQRKIHDRSDNTADIEQTNEQIRNLIGQVEQLSFEVNKLNKSLEQISGDFTKQLTEVEEKIKTNSVKSANLDTKKEATLTDVAAPENENHSVTEEKKEENTSSVEAAYKAAVKKYNDEHYPEAERALAAFIKNNPKHHLTAGAYFYLGETFFMQNNFEKASINYMYCYKKFPNSQSNSFIPYSMYRLGRSLLRLNKAKEACNGFNRALAYKSEESLKKKILDEIKLNHCGK